MSDFAKKLLSFIAVLSLLVSGTPCLSAAAGEQPLNIAVASDLHYCLPEPLEGEIDDEIYWYANRRAAMENESGFIIDAFLSQCAENESDFVLISGDMANDGRTTVQQHLDVAAKLSAFERTSGKQVFVIDGNHDLAFGSETEIDDFKRIYASFGYDEALAVDPESCSYSADLNGEYRLIALDSCDHSVSTADGLNDERMAWLKAQAEQAQSDGRHIVLMMHHNLLDHMPMQSVLSKNFIVKNSRSTAAAFANMGIKVVFTGHEHCSDVSGYINARGNRIYDFATTSLTMYPLQYRMVSFSDEKIVYGERTVDSIDTVALSEAADGYSPAQLSLMEGGLNDYSFGFFQAGIRHRLELSLSMEKIGIAQGEAFYSLVNSAVTGLKEILEMPLYGENSVASLAAEYKIDIPASAYENGWDLVTTLASTHYAGGEALDLESAEITILLRTAALILRDDLAGVADEVFLGAVNSVLSGLGIDGVARELTKLGASVFGAVTPGEYFILALASPFLFEFACDSDGVDDNRGELEGYAPQASDSAAATLSEKIEKLVADISLYFSLFVKYLTRAFLTFI